MKSSVTSQKYSCPGNEQNHDIHVEDDVGVDEAVEMVSVSVGAIQSISARRSEWNPRGTSSARHRRGRQHHLVL